MLFTVNFFTGVTQSREIVKNTFFCQLNWDNNLFLNTVMLSAHFPVFSTWDIYNVDVHRTFLAVNFFLSSLQM